MGSVVGLKFFNVYGPGESFKDDMSSLFYKAYHQIKQEGKTKLFKSHRDDFEDGKQLRDFIYIKDAVDMTLHLLDNRLINGIFNIGTGKARSFYDLAVSAFTAMNREVNIEFIDMPVTLRNKYQYFTESDMRKLRESGYDKPTMSFDEAAKDYVAYLESNPPTPSDS